MPRSLETLVSYMGLSKPNKRLLNQYKKYKNEFISAMIKKLAHALPDVPVRQIVKEVFLLLNEFGRARGGVVISTVKKHKIPKGFF